VEKRGRFNLGEKLVLALSEDAEIHTTTGTVWFDDSGRHRSNKCTEKGSYFKARLKMTRAQYEQVVTEVSRVIPPEQIRTTFNGSPLHNLREKVISFEATLSTVFATKMGSCAIPPYNLGRAVPAPARREGDDLRDGHPVVETGDTFHVNVMQKVPLNMDRTT